MPLVPAPEGSRLPNGKDGGVVVLFAMDEGLSRAGEGLGGGGGALVRGAGGGGAKLWRADGVRAGEGAK